MRRLVALAGIALFAAAFLVYCFRGGDGERARTQDALTQGGLVTFCHDTKWHVGSLATCDPAKAGPDWAAGPERAPPPAFVFLAARRRPAGREPDVTGRRASQRGPAAAPASRSRRPASRATARARSVEPPAATASSARSRAVGRP